MCCSSFFLLLIYHTLFVTCLCYSLCIFFMLSRLFYVDFPISLKLSFSSIFFFFPCKTPVTLALENIFSRFMKNILFLFSMFFFTFLHEFLFLGKNVSIHCNFSSSSLSWFLITCEYFLLLL